MDFSPGVLVLFSLLCSVACQAPVVLVEPRAATVSQGESVSFRCQVRSGAKPIQLEWKRANNQPLQDNVKIGPDGSVLTFTDARPGNQGQYQCVAGNSAGSSTATVMLNFKQACQAPVVSVEPRAATVHQGESVSFRCQVGCGVQPIQLEWKRATNQALPVNVRNSSDGSVLTFADARPGNQGQYRCVATNSAGHSTAAVMLNVKFGPKVQLTPAGPLQVTVGDPVSVECHATGKPRPKVTWKRQGSARQLVTSETNNVNTLQWPAVKPEDYGTYICRAENNEGVTEVKVDIIVQLGSGAPLASVGTTEMTVVEGHNVTMNCRASGSPLPVITWSKLRAPLPRNHTVEGGVLTLTSVGRQDSGQYICNATNIHGFSEAYTQVEVESPPYATCLPDQVKLRPGEALSLQCLAHGSHPIQFKWSRVGRANLPAGAQSTEDGKLLIAQVKLGDSGTYKCVATNHIGSSEVLAKVTIKA